MLKKLFSSLRDSVASTGGGGKLGRGGFRHELNGVFSKLIEPEQFRRIALSRLSEEERSRAPSSLQVKYLPCTYTPTTLSSVVVVVVVVLVVVVDVVQDNSGIQSAAAKPRSPTS